MHRIIRVKQAVNPFWLQFGRVLWIGWFFWGCLVSCDTSIVQKFPDISEEVSPRVPVKGKSPVVITKKEDLFSLSLELPQKEGLFVQKGEQWEKIGVGDKKALFPTSRKTGFGFVEPCGQVLTIKQTKLFLLHSSTFRSKNLIISRYKPNSKFNKTWWKVEKKGYDAWLYEGSVSTEVLFLEERNYSVVIPKNSLEPGMYALHDGAIELGRAEEDIIFYYPFQVVPELNDDINKSETGFLWADLCFSSIEAKLIEGLTKNKGELTHPKLKKLADSIDAGKIRECVDYYHVLLANREGPDAKIRARAGLFSLFAVHEVFPAEEYSHIIDATDPNFRGGALLFLLLNMYRLERLREISEELERGQILSDAQIKGLACLMGKCDIKLSDAHLLDTLFVLTPMLHYLNSKGSAEISRSVISKGGVSKVGPRFLKWMIIEEMLPFCSTYKENHLCPIAEMLIEKEASEDLEFIRSLSENRQVSLSRGLHFGFPLLLTEGEYPLNMLSTTLELGSPFLVPCFNILRDSTNPKAPVSLFVILSLPPSSEEPMVSPVIERVLGTTDDDALKTCTANALSGTLLPGKSDRMVKLVIPILLAPVDWRSGHSEH